MEKSSPDHTQAITNGKQESKLTQKLKQMGKAKIKSTQELKRMEKPNLNQQEAENQKI